MADVKARYTFRFGNESEVQYLSRAPEVGERVAHRRELWVVADVRSDPLGVIVVCERSNPAPGRNGGAVEAHSASRR